MKRGAFQSLLLAAGLIAVFAKRHGRISPSVWSRKPTTVCCRWKMIPLALLAAWAGIDGVYSLYWWCRGFDALSVFRVPNAIYSAPLYFLLGFAMNLEFCQSSERKETCHG